MALHFLKGDQYILKMAMTISERDNDGKHLIYKTNSTKLFQIKTISLKVYKKI